MFVIKNIKVTQCMACEKQVECFEVECPTQALAGWLCLPHFRMQVKIAAAKVSGTASVGDERSQQPMARPKS